MWLRKFFIILAILLFFAVPVSAQEITVEDVGKQLICQCGCNMVLTSCSHAECSSREQMLAFIRQQLGKGQSEQQIIQAMVSQYGEQVLASPPKKGFNLTAWLLPFIAILLGVVVIAVAVREWTRRGKLQPAPVETVTGDEDKYLRRLEKDLKEFTERGFR